jgi:flagellar biosynthesis protein FlhF
MHMQILRFTAPDIRDAMRQVRDALGPDAVILDTRRTESGLEVSAAAEHTEAAGATSRATVQQLPRQSEIAKKPIAATRAEAPAATAAPAASWPDVRRLESQMQTLRGLLESELARLTWNDKVRRNAPATSIIRNLARLGVTPQVAQRVVSEIGEHAMAADSWTDPLRTLVDDIPVTDEDTIAGGGVFALVGPTGVGKTTTIAKLAARYALKASPADIALVTTDSFRIAAREQLETFGQILGVPVYQAADSDRLRETLKALGGRRLVLVDTAGMGQRDVRLAGQLNWLTGADARVKVLLALPANAQTVALQEIVDAFLVARPTACILTKTDEASSLGGAISVLIHNGLPLAYVANGQRVPEDLHFARPRKAWLIKSALELLGRVDEISDDFIADNFGEVTVDACA